MSTEQIVERFTNAIVNPALALLFTVGLLVFAWGVIEFLIGLNISESDKKEEGKKHMLWGVVGMFIMVSAWAILGIIDRSVGSNVL